MRKVRITVLKTTFDKDLAAEYGAEGLTACPMMKEGQVFMADYAKPEGFCDEAWKAIYQYVFALAHGSGEEVFYFGDWIRTAKPGACAASLIVAGNAARSKKKSRFSQNRIDMPPGMEYIETNGFLRKNEGRKTERCTIFSGRSGDGGRKTKLSAQNRTISAKTVKI